MLVTPAQQAAADSSAQPGPGGPGGGHGGRTSQAGGSNLNRVPSLGGSMGDGEFKNRKRGGGGGDMGQNAASIKRAETRRQSTGNVGGGVGGGGGGDGGEGQEAQAAEEGEPPAAQQRAIIGHLRCVVDGCWLILCAVAVGRSRRGGRRGKRGKEQQSHRF